MRLSDRELQKVTKTVRKTVLRGGDVGGVWCQYLSNLGYNLSYFPILLKSSHFLPIWPKSGHFLS